MAPEPNRDCRPAATESPRCGLYGEPSLDEVLADPIVLTLLHCDGIAAAEVRSFIERRARGQAALPPRRLSVARPLPSVEPPV